MIDTLRLTAEEARGLLERGEVSGAELFAAYRAAIDERDEELHCFLTLVEEPANPGVPIALKDVIGTKGVRTTAGSKILENYVPVYDSTVAARCKDAGLTLLGKTNTDEFAMGRAASDLRNGFALRHRRICVLARPGRARHAHGARQRTPLPDHQRPRRVRFDVG